MPIKCILNTLNVCHLDGQNLPSLIVSAIVSYSFLNSSCTQAIFIQDQQSWKNEGVTGQQILRVHNERPENNLTLKVCTG